MLHDISPCRPSRAHIEPDARVERLTGRLQAVTGFGACQQTVACVGTEHILLGLIREGEGVAAQVLVRLGADLNWVRQQVIQLLHGYQGKEQQTARARPWPGPGERRLLSEANARVSAIDTHLAAIGQRVGTGPDTGDLDEQIQRVRGRDAVDRFRYLPMAEQLVVGDYQLSHLPGF